jgi:hypothetical protein
VPGFWIFSGATGFIFIVMDVPPVAVSRPTLVSCIQTGSHKIMGSDIFTKDVLAPKELYDVEFYCN